MALTKVKLKNLIKQSFLSNTDNVYSSKNVVGMTIDKKIIPTKANVDNSNLTKYLIVKPNYFIMNPRTHGKKIGLGFNNTNSTYILSWNNITFYVSREDLLLPEYLFMQFNRLEWDRQACFNSWGSSTEVFSFDTLCNMELDLPSIEIQKKYVAIYKSMVANQKSYEAGLEDLKLVCDAHIENLRHEIPCEEIGPYVFNTNLKNGNTGLTNVKGISVYKTFREPTSKVNKNELTNYKIVRPREMSFVQTTHNEKVFAYALNNTNDNILVSSVNEVFYCNLKKLLPEYLSLFFNRNEFDRYARFHSWGSARETFTWNDLVNVKIPIPSIEIQQSIANIYVVYTKRKEINEKLKTQIKELCPILIKGAIEEAKK